MISGEIGVCLENIVLHKDQVTFKDKDGHAIHICMYDRKNNVVEKLLDALSEYQERNMDEDIGYMF
jgi:hypothetical protein